MSRGRAGLAGGVAVLAVIAGACAEVGSGPATVVSLAFDTSTVAVVVGDTLRDSLGQLLPLRAAAFSASGDTIREPDVAISYIAAPVDSADTAAVVRIAGALVIGARLRETPGRVFATAGGLQSLPKSIDVIRRPTRLVPVTVLDSALYTPGTTSALSAGADQVRVTARLADTAASVRRVAVRFVVERAASRIADSVDVIDERPPTFVAGAVFVPRSPLDTTNGSGVAGRRVLVYLKNGAAGTDTVVLRATVAYPARFGAPPTLAADTVRVTVAVRPRASAP